MVKVALVTGGSKGIGYAAAIAMMANEMPFVGRLRRTRG